MTNQKSMGTDRKEARTGITKVVLIGHCGFDQASISRAVARAIPGVAIESAYNTADLEPHTGSGVLLLINRVLDGRSPRARVLT